MALQGSLFKYGQKSKSIEKTTWKNFYKIRIHKLILIYEKFNSFSFIFNYLLWRRTLSLQGTYKIYHS